MKNIIILIMITIGFSGYSQSRIYFTYQEIQAELDTNTNKYEWEDKTNDRSAFIFIKIENSEIYISHYFTNGKEKDSFVYKTVVYIGENERGALNYVIKNIEKSNYRTNQNNWYNYNNASVILINWSYDNEIGNIISYQIKLYTLLPTVFIKTLNYETYYNKST